LESAENTLFLQVGSEIMIKEVLQRPEFEAQPPVLLDIGASGTIHRPWRKFAKYAICIAFDADERDFGYIQAESDKYRKLYIYNALVADKKSAGETFYLTQSPHCSSLLRPNPEGLREMAWAERFEIVKTIQLPTIDLPSVLSELKIDYADWFKTDSQGIDLRLFQSLKPEIRQKTLVAEFEPGIIDAYFGEDKLYKILETMHQEHRFWLADLVVKGVARISPATLKTVYSNRFLQKLAMFSLPRSADWGEMTFVNTLADEADFTLRDYLLQWVFTTNLGQHGFALGLAQRAQVKFKDVMLPRLERYTKSRIRWRVWRLGFFPAIQTKMRQLLDW
jgi:hypothetical protein